MKEAYGDLWTFPADMRVITTNGCVTRAGKAVMGRGCAKEAKERFPGIDRELGEFLRSYGNQVFIFPHYGLLTFPVKHHWKEKADIALIERSAIKLVKLCDDYFYNWETVVLPRPGCGNGGLQWEEVKKVLKPIFDDRFVVITK